MSRNKIYDFAVLFLAVMFLSHCGKKENFAEFQTQNSFKLVYSKNRNLTIGTFENNSIKNETEITSAGIDWKPSWSKTGNQIVFFRYGSGATEYPPTDPKDIANWKNKICVINSDGTGYRELTDGTKGDFNATWLRDGTNRIIFIRLSEAAIGEWETYITHPDTKPGDEVKITGNYNAGGMSSLIDSSIVISGNGCVYLLKGNPASALNWQTFPIIPSLPANVIATRTSISPDETKILYAADFSNFTGTYDGMNILGDNDPWDQKDCVLYVADFNRSNNTITNPKIINPRSSFTYQDGYNRWSPDGKKIIFHSKISGIYQLYLYDLEHNSGPILLSPDTSSTYYFPCSENTPI